MQIDDLDILASEISRRANENAIHIQGPAEIEYGFGWEPTITFWSGNRRVHFYFGMETYKEGVTVEVAEIKPNQTIRRGNVDTNSEVMCGIINTFDEAWIIVEKFLSQEYTFEKLPKYGWKTDSGDHDKFIPHPPSAPNAGNVASLVKGMQQLGEPWHSSQLQKSQSWLQRLRDWFQKQEKSA
jgi:hypothetical protein